MVSAVAGRPSASHHRSIANNTPAHPWAAPVTVNPAHAGIAGIAATARSIAVQHRGAMLGEPHPRTLMYRRERIEQQCTRDQHAGVAKHQIGVRAIRGDG